MTQFRARSAATQGISGSVETPLVFGTESFDTDAAFASNIFTVPASWDGLYAEFFSSLWFDPIDENGYISIQVSTNGGGAWSFVATTQYYQAIATNVGTGPLLMNTGDIYRATVNNTSVATIRDNNLTFFSGRLIDPAVTPTREYFRAHAASTQVIADATLTPVNVGTELFDTGNNFSGGVYTVPADLNGGYGIFTVGLASNGGSFADDVYSYVTQSTGGGFTIFNAAKISQLTKGSTCSSGPVALVTGHQFRAETYTNTGGYTLSSGVKTFFSGDLYI